MPPTALQHNIGGKCGSLTQGKTTYNIPLLTGEANEPIFSLTEEEASQYEQLKSEILAHSGLFSSHVVTVFYRWNYV